MTNGCVIFAKFISPAGTELATVSPATKLKNTKTKTDTITAIG